MSYLGVPWNVFEKHGSGFFDQRPTGHERTNRLSGHDGLLADFRGFAHGCAPFPSLAG
jgi:hypothetical protein